MKKDQDKDQDHFGIFATRITLQEKEQSKLSTSRKKPKKYRQIKKITPTTTTPTTTTMMILKLQDPHHQMKNDDTMINRNRKR